MAKTEKIAFILEQVRLCLDKKDYVRCVYPTPSWLTGNACGDCACPDI